jgi:hypothetical protein
MPPGGSGELFAALNRGKRSLVLDLKQPGAVDAVRRVLARCDVLVEGSGQGDGPAGLGHAALLGAFPAAGGLRARASGRPGRPGASGARPRLRGAGGAPGDGAARRRFRGPRWRTSAGLGGGQRHPGGAARAGDDGPRPPHRRVAGRVGDLLQRCTSGRRCSASRCRPRGGGARRWPPLAACIARRTTAGWRWRTRAEVLRRSASGSGWDLTAEAYGGGEEADASARCWRGPSPARRSPCGTSAWRARCPRGAGAAARRGFSRRPPPDRGPFPARECWRRRCASAAGGAPPPGLGEHTREVLDEADSRRPRSTRSCPEFVRGARPGRVGPTEVS